MPKLHRSRIAVLVASFSLAGCGGSDKRDVAPREPLLDLNPIRSPFMLACAGRPDDTPLPIDPRSRVTPELDLRGRVVQFNAWWRDVHDPGAPYLLNELQRPTTCGAWRAQVSAGEAYLRELAMAGALATATAYNQLWAAWGLTARPADFDLEVVRRYGLAPARHRNPYPLPGEDPALSDGGSGQLPLGLVQTRGADGRFDGGLSINCSICHDSELGDESDGLGTIFGKGNDNLDLAALFSDFAHAGGSSSTSRVGGLLGGLPIPLAGTTRGVTDPTTGLELLLMIRDLDTLDVSPNAKIFPLHASGGGMDGVSWWNLSHRPRKFVSGDLSSDEIRAMQTFLMTDMKTFGNGAEFKKQGPAFENVKSYIESLSPPPFPRPFDRALAETGAVLFHTKDLWADPVNRALPRPPSNGSCAGCHGAYAPRYAADPDFLPDPALKGVAGYLVPAAMIGTDPNRARQVDNDAVRTAWDTSWFGYVDLNSDYATSAQAQGGDTFGQFLDDYAIYAGKSSGRLAGPNTWQPVSGVYLAPVLYGVWASAPYLHNGSVPDVWGVLDPSTRPAVWQRQLTAPGASGINRGFDRSLNAYDFDRLGWKYTELPCTTSGALAAASCTPGMDVVNAALAMLAVIGGPSTWLSYLYMPPTTQAQLDSRLVYNTYQYTQSNQGHTFTQSLSDAERRALIEYLKTL